MYQGDTQRHEAQPQDGPEKEAQVEVKEISAQDKMRSLRPTIPENEQAILDLTEKLNLEIKLRSDSESNAQVLYAEREYLKNKAEGLAINLAAQTKLGCDSAMAWHRRFFALEEESNNKEKASESNFRATIQEKEEAILDLTEKLNLELKLRSNSESNAEVLYSEREYLKNKAEGLAINLAAQTKLGRDNGMAWHRRFSTLEEESNNKEKASESNFRAKIQEKEEAILDLTEKLNLELKVRSNSESNAEVLNSERKYLEDQVKSLANDLEARAKLGRDSDMAWQSRFSALEEESNNKEKASESTSKALLTECQYMEKKTQSLSEDLKAQTKLVSDSDKTWKDKMSAVKRESALKERTILTTAHAERDALLQKLKEQSSEMHSLKVKYESEQNNHEEEIRRLRRQIVNLEDICLRQKKKNLGFFGRRMEDREVELERMKVKVPAREPVDPPPPVQCSPPVDPPGSLGLVRLP